MLIILLLEKKVLSKGCQFGIRLDSHVCGCHQKNIRPECNYHKRNCKDRGTEIDESYFKACSPCRTPTITSATVWHVLCPVPLFKRYNIRFKRIYKQFTYKLSAREVTYHRKNNYNIYFIFCLYLTTLHQKKYNTMVKSSIYNISERFLQFIKKYY